MAFTLGPKSLVQLGTVEDALQRVITRAIELTEVDFSVMEGVRSMERQYELFTHGRTVDELRKAGVPAKYLAQPGLPKVTWTLKSKHFAPAPGKPGRAVDLGVFPYDPNAGLAVYRKIKDAVFKAAAEQKVRIRWGGDWNQNGTTEHGESDIGHFELA